MNMNVISPWLYRFGLVWAGLALPAPGLTANPPPQAINQSPSILYPKVDVQDVKSLDVYVDHATLHVLIAGQVFGEPKLVLKYLRSDDSGKTWSAPVPIDSRAAPPGRVMRGNDVQIAAAGDRLIAVWHTAGAGYMGSGPLVTAISEDGGITWRTGPNPADDQRQDGHSYIDINADPQETFHLVWLDNREDRKGVQGLRYARSTDGGQSWSRNATVDGDTCTCCWNTLATSSQGAVHILYREALPRDMALARSKDGGKQWELRGAVGRFAWNFEGCPHMGGGLAAVGAATARLHSLVWTGGETHAGLYYLRSADGGERWTEPRRMGAPMAGHSDITAQDETHLAAVWDTVTPEGSVIFAAESTDGGTAWATPGPLSKPGVSATHPRVVAIPAGYLAFWTERTGEKPNVLAATFF